MLTGNVPALAAGGELEPQNCHAKQMQFRKKKLPPKQMRHLMQAHVMAWFNCRTKEKKSPKQNVSGKYYLIRNFNFCRVEYVV